jgi:hypothetical protein
MLSIGEFSAYISYLFKRRQTNFYLFMERFNLIIFTVSLGFEPENAIALLGVKFRGVPLILSRLFLGRSEKVAVLAELQGSIT